MTTAAVIEGACLRQIVQELLDLFGPYLGTYHHLDGTETPAYWAIKAGMVRPEITATGIEMILLARPHREPLGTFGTILTMRRWDLTFTQFDTSSDLSAIELLAYRAWPRAPQRRMDQTKDTFERLTIELLDPVVTPPL